MYTKPLLPFALLAISVVGFYWLAPVGVVVALWLAIQERSPLAFLNYLLRVAEGVARCLDILLNVIGGPLLNRFAVRRDSPFYAFGRVEYMSTAFGHNQASNTLSKSGSRVAESIDSVDPGHCRRSAGLPTAPVTISRGRILLNQILLIALCVGLVAVTVWLVSK